MKALIIQKYWLDMIFSGQKTWEIRGQNTKTRGRIGLVESGSGLIVGECELVASSKVNAENFDKSRELHRIKIGPSPYVRTFAWELKNAKRFDKPIPYTHPRGAVVWVDLAKQGITL